MILEKVVTGIILVAGNSTRFGKNRNKNFELINGKTILSYSINASNSNKYIDNIIIVIKENERNIVQEIINSQKLDKNVKIVLGGASRQESVYNAIKNTESDIVIIHDGARPAIKQEYINKTIEEMINFKGVTIDLNNYRKSVWWKGTAKYYIKDKITIRTLNTVRKLYELCGK